MKRRLPVGMFLGLGLSLGLGCGGDDGGGGPVTPTLTPTVTSVSVTFPAGGPIFLGSQVQFQAQVTLSDGTTQPATNATWGSDAPGVATVSSTGLVTALAAGEATIFADVNPRGTMRIRVFPDVGGNWSGAEVVTHCEESGDWVGFICVPDVFAVGNVFTHNARFTQNGESVDAEIIFGDGSSTMTGTISIGGDLQLPAAPVLPADPDVETLTQNWRSRADVPGQMTGQYEWLITAPGLEGSSRQVYQLQDVVRTGAALTPSSSAGEPAKATMLRRIAEKIGKSR